MIKLAIFLIFASFGFTFGIEIECNVKAWEIPLGNLTGEVANVKEWEDCCDLCGTFEGECTAYSYNIVSEDCRFWNHTSFTPVEDKDIRSGIVLQPGIITEPVVSTTIAPAPCPIDNIDPNVKMAHPTDCDKYFICASGNWDPYSCWEDYRLLYDYTLEQCKSPKEVNCYPGATRPPPDPTTPEMPSTTEISPVQCTSEGIYNMTYPGDCSKYVMCVNGVAHVAKCDRDFLFDAVTLTCTPSSEAYCFTTPTTISPVPTTTNSATTYSSTVPPSTTELPMDCPPVGIIDYPHPTDCRKYIMCFNGNGRVETCPEGMNFDSIELKCKSPEEAVCYVPTESTTDSSPSETTTSLTTPSVTTTRPSTTTSRPSTTTAISSTTTLRPSTSTSTVRPSTTTLRPSSTTMSTTNATESSASTVSTTTEDPHKCPGSGSINLPHPTDCTKYIMCFNGNSVEIDCQPGEKFDYPTRICMSEALAECFVG